MQEALIVRRETRIPAPPAAVFALLTDPEKILRWMGTEAQLAAQPGGLYLVNVTGARFARGSFREVVPVHRLAYSFGWDGSDEVPPGSSLVEIDLIEQPDGTLLRLTHTGLPNAGQCASHAEGWAHYLGRLAEVAAGRDPGPGPPARPHWQGVTAFMVASSDYGRLFFQAEVFRAERLSGKRARSAAAITEPARLVPVFRDCDVLVAGGGPAGTAAAIAAARAGADVVLIERHNHLGGLSTGGLVIWIDRMTDWSGRRVIEGIAAELLDRLPRDAVAGPSRSDWGSVDAATAAYWKERTAAFHGIVTWSPTIDPEHLKLLSQEIVLGAGVHLVFHAWAAAPIIEEGRVAGAVFESKEGRLAIRAGVTIDCTGDGDLFHRAGAGSESDIDERDIHHCTNTAWLFGAVDMPRWIAFKTGDSAGFSAFMERGRAACGGLFERPFVSWRDDVALFLGPRLAGYSAVDVEDQTEVEIRSHRLMALHLAVYREHAPGFANAYLLLSAPQLGVRHARRLVGVGRVTREDWSSGAPRPDEIGISPSLSPTFPLLSVPYGCLVPRNIDGLLVAGRHISCDPSSHSFLREIPQCWLTGQAAGAAAALAAAQHCAPRAVPIAELQALLQRQGVILRAAAEPTTTSGPDAQDGPLI